MAIDAQVDVLKQDAQIWNAWRAERPESVPDLSGGRLRGFDLRNADLSGADLCQADLRGADLSGANLKGANLEGANLFKALINGADLTRAGLRGVQFLNCPQLETALNWQSTYRDEDLACGAVIPSH